MLCILKKVLTFAVAFGLYALLAAPARELSGMPPTIYQAKSFWPATVAQLVEQRIRNAWVAGSSPASGSKHKHLEMRCLCYFLLKSL